MDGLNMSSASPLHSPTTAFGYRRFSASAQRVSGERGSLDQADEMSDRESPAAYPQQSSVSSHRLPQAGLGAKRPVWHVGPSSAVVEEEVVEDESAENKDELDDDSEAARRNYRSDVSGRGIMVKQEPEELSAKRKRGAGVSSMCGAMLI